MGTSLQTKALRLCKMISQKMVVKSEFKQKESNKNHPFLINKENEYNHRLLMLEDKVNVLMKRKDKYKLKLKKTQQALVPQKELLAQIRTL